MAARAQLTWITKVIVLALYLSGGLFACRVPVFRYALERWPADDFRLLVTSRGGVSKELRQKLSELDEQLEESPGSINLELQVIDLDSLSEADRISIPALKEAGEEPTMILLPPASWMTKEPAWKGAATASNLSRLLDSPTRKRVADHLVRGESAVWIVVECGDAEKDAKAKALLSAGLAKAAELLEVPTGVVRREDLNRELPNIDLENVLRSEIPLKISFVTETLSRTDPAEALFLPILAEPEALQSGEPLIIPVFGRGRTPGALPGSELTLDRIFGACQYLCGACSCQAKAGNPGFDLLFSYVWDAYLSEEEITAESEVVQQALDVVTFSPEEDATTVSANAGDGPMLAVVIVLVVLAVGGLIYTTGRSSTS